MDEVDVVWKGNLNDFLLFVNEIKFELKKKSMKKVQ